jgi:hypothetical protein
MDMARSPAATLRCGYEEARRLGQAGGGTAAATALIAGDVRLTFQNLGTVALHASGR